MVGKRLINSNDAAAGSACTTNTNDYPITNVAYYKMSSAADEKGTYNGTASNVNFNVQGKFGNAGEFNGSSSQVALPKIPELTDDVSVSLWVNLASTSSGSYLRMIALNGVSNDGTLTVLYNPSGGNWLVYVGNGTTSSTNVLYHTYALTQSTWYHICITRNDSTNVTKLYVDGSEKDSETVSATATIQSNATGAIGSSVPLYFGSVWNGKIDQVRIFSSALDATQVSSLYNEVHCAPTIVPTSYFNTVLYTGTGSGSKSVTGVGFQPDLVWGKARNSSALSHILFDVVRGENKQISSDLPDAQVVRASAAYEFDSDGFTVTTAGNLNNQNNFVAWNWKAGGAAVSNTDGTVTSQVSANVDAGFSIVQYTGTGSLATVGHGLNQPVELILVKNTSASASWAVYSAPTGINKFLELNSAGATTSYSNYWGAATPTNDVFGVVNGNFNNNATNDSLIAYCFHSVAGYSKIGSYTGTGASGNTIVTGFRPAYLMTKRTDVSGYNWYIWDNKRSPTNPRDKVLYADASVPEYDFSAYPHDFNSNGFSVDTTNAAFNASGATYIFMAFAEEALPYVTRNATDPFGDSSELALYKFEDDATDAEGNYNGTASNVTYASGYIDKTAVFNGSNARIDTGVQLSSSDNYSISMWVYVPAIFGTFLAGNINSSANNGFYVSINSTGTGRFYLRPSSGSVSVIDGTTAMSTGQWNHFAITSSSTTNNLYVNGQLDGTASRSSVTFSSSITLGRAGDYAASPFEGSIDQVRIFNRALDDGEVTALYNE